MKIQWTNKASSGLVRLYLHLSPVAPGAAAHVVRQLAHAPARLLDYPRIGEKLEAYEPREIRRIIVGNYEMRYEIAGPTIFILRLWHCRENRTIEPELWNMGEGRGSAPVCASADTGRATLASPANSTGLAGFRIVQSDLI